MVIKAITHGLHYEIANNERFHPVFSVIITQLTEFMNQQKEFEDYCIFIKVSPTDLGTEIVFHDGGAKYDEELDDLVYVTYATIKVKRPIDKEYTLYYSVDEKILCFLEER